jgi:hypothetical protein
MNKRLGKLNLKFSGELFHMLSEILSFLPDSSEEADLIFDFSTSPLNIDNKLVFGYEPAQLFENNELLLSTSPFNYLVKGSQKLERVRVVKNKRKGMHRAADFLRRSQYKFQHFASSDDYYFEKFYSSGFLPLTFLAMMEKSQIFLHSSCISNKEEAIAFTGGGNVGKTSLATSLIFKYGFKFLSDDMSIIDDDGIVYLNPSYVGFSPSNIDKVPLLQTKLFKELSFGQKMQWQCLRKLLGNSGVSKRILPTHLFPDSIQKEPTKLKFVVFLQNSSSKDLRIESITADNLAIYSKNLMLTELTPALPYLMAATLFEERRPQWAVDFILKMENLYRRIFNKTDCFILYLPSRPNLLQDTAKFLLKNIGL